MVARTSSSYHATNPAAPHGSLAAAMIRTYLALVLLAALAVSSLLYTVVETEGLAGRDLAYVVDYTLTRGFDLNADVPRLGLEWGAYVLPLILPFPAILALLPTINAFRRRHPNRYFIAALNLAGGWMVPLWLVALAWSVWTLDELRRLAEAKAGRFNATVKLPAGFAKAMAAAKAPPWAGEARAPSPPEDYRPPQRAAPAKPLNPVVPPTTAGQSAAVVRRGDDSGIWRRTR